MSLISKFSSIRNRAVLTLVAAFLLVALGVSLTLTSSSAAGTNVDGRTIRAVSTTASPGGQVVVSIELDSLGDEVAASFTVNFDPTKLSSPALTIGNAVPAGTALTANMNQVATGKIGLLLDSANAFVAAPPARQMLSIRFDVSPNMQPGDTTVVSFSNTPTPRSTSNFTGDLLVTNYEAGTVTISGQQVVPVTVSGRVTSPTGQSLRNVLVTMADSLGQRRTVATSSLGYYSFDNVAPGQTYTFTASSKKFRFSPQTLQVNDNLSNVDFVGIE